MSDVTAAMVNLVLRLLERSCSSCAHKLNTHGTCVNPSCKLPHCAACQQPLPHTDLCKFAGVPQACTIGPQLLTVHGVLQGLGDHHVRAILASSMLREAVPGPGIIEVVLVLLARLASSTGSTVSTNLELVFLDARKATTVLAHDRARVIVRALFADAAGTPEERYKSVLLAVVFARIMQCRLRLQLPFDADDGGDFVERTFPEVLHRFVSMFGDLHPYPHLKSATELLPHMLLCVVYNGEKKFRDVVARCLSKMIETNVERALDILAYVSLHSSVTNARSLTLSASALSTMLQYMARVPSDKPNSVTHTAGLAVPCAFAMLSTKSDGAASPGRDHDPVATGLGLAKHFAYAVDWVVGRECRCSHEHQVIVFALLALFATRAPNWLLLPGHAPLDKALQRFRACREGLMLTVRVISSCPEIASVVADLRDQHNDAVRAHGNADGAGSKRACTGDADNDNEADTKRACTGEK